jgi:Peptidase family M23
MRALPWILGGGTAALAAYLWTRRDRDASKAPPTNTPIPSTPPSSPGSTTTPARSEPLPGRWVWPVGVWHGRKPQISDGYSSKRRTPAGEVITHGGVDLMYLRLPGDICRAGTPNGSRGYVMPDHRPALAASDGVVWFAANTPRGWSVIIDHTPRKVATYYTHLSSLLVTPKQKIGAGMPIGIIGADPLDAAHLMHLHFEVWRGGAKDRIDPGPLMTAWEYLPDPGEPTGAIAARNASSRAHGVPVQADTRRWPRHGG